MKRLIPRLALFALILHPAFAGGSEGPPDDPASGAPASPVVAAEPGPDLSLSPNLMAGLFVGSALFSLTLHLALRHHRRSVGQLDRVRRKEHLMTPAEREFLAVLEPLVRSACRISIKVRLADLFEIRPERGRQPAFHRVANRQIDFLLTEHASGRILCGIKLGGRPGTDALVDRLFASQRIPLFRVPFARHHDAQGLGDILALVLGKAHAG